MEGYLEINWGLFIDGILQTKIVVHMFAYKDKITDSKSFGGQAAIYIIVCRLLSAEKSTHL